MIPLLSVFGPGGAVPSVPVSFLAFLPPVPYPASPCSNKRGAKKPSDICRTKTGRQPQPLFAL